jgi:hypothetical protein
MCGRTERNSHQFTLRRHFEHGPPVKQRKIAISLAVVGAIAAPFVFHTNKARPIAHGWVPLTAEEKAAIAGKLKETNNCQTYDDQLNEALRDVVDPHKRTEIILRNGGGSCQWDRGRLEAGGDFGNYPDTLKYLAINAATAGSAFAVIFGLTYLLPALARRYWQWLKT